MLVGYVRVSTAEQNTVRQDVMMEELGVEKIFVDKSSGKNTERQGLKEMLSFVRQGDVLVVESISRLSRNAKDFLEIFETLQSKGVEFKSLKESFDTSTPAGKAMLTMFAAIAELERSYILERQREGINQAKLRGIYKGKTKKETDWEEFGKQYKLWKGLKQTAVQTRKKLGMSTNTFYRRVVDYEKMNGITNGLHCKPYEEGFWDGKKIARK